MSYPSSARPTANCSDCGRVWYPGHRDPPVTVCTVCRLRAQQAGPIPTGDDGSGRPRTKGLRGAGNSSRSPSPAPTPTAPPNTPAAGLEAQYRGMTQEERENHMRALFAVVGPDEIVRLGDSAGRPEVSVLTAAMEAVVAVWEGLGLEAAVDGYQDTEVANAYGASEREQQADLLSAVSAVAALARPVLEEMPAGRLESLLCDGVLGRVAAGQYGDGVVHGVGEGQGRTRGIAPVTLQIVAVVEIDGRDGLFRVQLQVTDGTHVVPAYVFSQHHAALHDCLYSVVTLTEWSYQVSNFEASGGYIVASDLVPGDPADPFRPQASLAPAGASYPRLDAPPDPAGVPSAHAVPGTHAALVVVEPVAACACDGCWCTAVEAEAGTHGVTSPGPGCVLARVNARSYTAIWDECRFTASRDVATASQASKRLACYWDAAVNLYAVRGGGNRCVLPLCIVTSIRARYPNPRGTPYTDDRSDGGMLIDLVNLAAISETMA